MADVIITRPLGQQLYLAARLTALGYDPVHLPLMQIEPVQSMAEITAVKQRIMHLDEYAAVVVVSMNAAKYGLDWLDQYWPQPPIGIDWVAVGPSTEEALTQAGLSVQRPSNSYDTEGMLALDCLQPERIKGKKILLWRGVGGRATLTQALQHAGAQVDFAEFYHRQPVTHSLHAWQQALVKQPVLMLSSTEQIDIIVHQAASLMPQAKLVITPTERCARKAREAGFKQVIAAASARDDDMIATLLTHDNNNEAEDAIS